MCYKKINVGKGEEKMLGWKGDYRFIPISFRDVRESLTNQDSLSRTLKKQGPEISAGGELLVKSQQVKGEQELGVARELQGGQCSCREARRGVGGNVRDASRARSLTGLCNHFGFCSE